MVSDTNKFESLCRENGLHYSTEHRLGADSAKTTYLVILDSQKIELLCKFDYILYIDRYAKDIEYENELLGFDKSINLVSALQSKYPENAGKGITIAVKEDSFDAYDVDFKGRTKAVVDSSDFFISRHATDMATIIGGAGNSAKRNQGVAWQSELTPSNFNDLLPNENTEIMNYGVSVQNHSYGVGIENYYGIEAMLYDTQSNEVPGLLHVFSSGNKGEEIPDTGPYGNLGKYANLTGQFKNSKNSICVGAINKFGNLLEQSSKGPAGDGRVKPEVVAYGFSGTSESAALVSGIAGLLQGEYLRENGELPASSLIKAAIVNGTRPVNGVLSFEHGHGNVDALDSFETIKEKRYFEGSIQDNETLTYRISLPEGTSNLSVTICWNDIPSIPGDESALVNDIDIELKGSGDARRVLPWVLSSYPNLDSLRTAPRRGVDSINNVEKITLSNTLSKEYEVIVHGKNIKGIQDFSIAYNYGSQDSWLFPVKASKLLTNTGYTIRWDSKKLSGKGTLQWKENGQPENSWQTIHSDINLEEDGFFEWVTPDHPTFAQFRITAAQGDLVSEEFSISPLNEHRSELYCDSGSVISWNTVPSADGYNIYGLGTKYMELVGQTNDSTYNIPHGGIDDSFFAVAPILNSKELLRTTGSYINQDIGCYFQDFYVETEIGSRPKLVGRLSTNRNIKEVHIQAGDDGEYGRDINLGKPQGLDFSFIDDFAAIGNNEYRAYVVTTDGGIFNSPSDRFFKIEDGNTIVSPNPVDRGENLYIHTGEHNEVLFQVFNMAGRLVFYTNQESTVKFLDTSALIPGIYILTISGKQISTAKKFMVR